jgi:hypothetical protein
VRHQPVFAADYRVSPSGNDSATGKLAQPWKTVDRAPGGFACGLAAIPASGERGSVQRRGVFRHALS